MPTKAQLIDQYDERLCVDYSGEYTAYAEKVTPYEIPMVWDDITGEVTSSELVTGYTITYHKGMMPAFSSTHADTLDELLVKMREIAPLSHWRIARMD